ncbi:hypothetical protein ACJX0J_034271, partial [Zea mays]
LVYHIYSNISIFRIKIRLPKHDRDHHKQQEFKPKQQIKIKLPLWLSVDPEQIWLPLNQYLLLQTNSNSVYIYIIFHMGPPFLSSVSVTVEIQITLFYYFSKLNVLQREYRAINEEGGRGEGEGERAIRGEGEGERAIRGEGEGERAIRGEGEGERAIVANAMYLIILFVNMNLIIAYKWTFTNIDKLDS